MADFWEFNNIFLIWRTKWKVVIFHDWKLIVFGIILPKWQLGSLNKHVSSVITVKEGIKEHGDCVSFKLTKEKYDETDEKYELNDDD